MKNYVSFWIWLLALCLLAEPSSALTVYGTARIKSGELTVVRNQQESIYVPKDGEVEIRVNDLLRVGRNSFVVLSTREETEIKMGSNAIFQVRPWKSRNKYGYMRMLYGKMNFQTKQLKQRKRFRFKTASATIGVKGTAADCEVGSTGNTGCTGRSGQTEIQGNFGPPQELTTNRMSIVVGNQPASQTIELPPQESGTDQQDDEKTFAKASPTTNTASSLSLESDAVDSGIIDQADLEESKQEEIGADTSLEQELELEATKEDEVVETDEAFEKDLQDSEADTEIVVLEVSAPLDLPTGTDVEAVDDAAPDIPIVDIEDDIEDAVQESKNAMGRLRLEFEK